MSDKLYRDLLDSLNDIEKQLNEIRIEITKATGKTELIYPTKIGGRTKLMRIRMPRFCR